MALSRDVQYFIEERARTGLYAYLEAHPGLYLVAKHLRHNLIEVRHDLDGQLGLDTTATNQVVERVCQRHADAVLPPCQWGLPADIRSASVTTWCCDTARRTWFLSPSLLLI